MASGIWDMGSHYGITLEYGEETSINCSAISNPPSNVSWWRTNPLDNTTTLMSWSMVTNTLVLTWHSSDTIGQYVCNASNDQGSSQAPPVDVLVTERGMGTSNGTINTTRSAHAWDGGLKPRGKNERTNEIYLMFDT